MEFYLAGTDYKIADLERRENIYAKRKEISAHWMEIFKESAALSTCNRFEIYGIAKDCTKFTPLDTEWYFIKGEIAVFTHALRVACGLESQLKGELQILEQINSWRKKIPSNLANLWNLAYLEALDVRRESGLCLRDKNIATFVFDDMKKKIEPGKELKVVVVGTGKVAGLLAEYRLEGVHLIFASHKNKMRAEELAEYAQGEAISLNGLVQVLIESDFLVSTTASSHRILKKEELEKIVSLRKQPLYIYDLAIPRDIDPSARAIEGLILKNLDDVSLIFQEHNEAIRDKLHLAEYLVSERVKEYERNAKDREPSKQVSLKTG